MLLFLAVISFLRAAGEREEERRTEGHYCQPFFFPFVFLPSLPSVLHPGRVSHVSIICETLVWSPVTFYWLTNFASWHDDYSMWKAQWPHGLRIGLWIEWSRFEPWPGSLCCILGQDMLLSQCLSPPRSINGYRR